MRSFARAGATRGGVYREVSRSPYAHGRAGARRRKSRSSRRAPRRSCRYGTLELASLVYRPMMQGRQDLSQRIAMLDRYIYLIQHRMIEDESGVFDEISFRKSGIVFLNLDEGKVSCKL